MENETEKGDRRYRSHVQFHCSVLGSLFKMCLGASHSVVFAGSVQRACKIRDLDMQCHTLKGVTPAVREERCCQVWATWQYSKKVDFVVVVVGE